jgi:hypothetical protein
MASTANKVYRGSNEQKKTISNLKTAGAYLPGTFCSLSATTLTQATTAAQRVVLLANREFGGQSIDTAYASGDTAVAYELIPTEPYVARFAAATYTYGQELTVGASGRLAAAASTNVVIGFYTGSGVALSAGDLDEFVVANSYIKA